MLLNITRLLGAVVQNFSVNCTEGVLATILYIRIVDADEQVERLGSEGWNDLLRRLRSADAK